jgi:hypothetical protein
MANLPQPNSNATSASAITSVILDSVPWLGPAIKTYLQFKLEEARAILLDEIKRYGLQALDDLTVEQRRFLVPAGYRFFEQVRLGEYAHNLRVLARLIAGEMTGEGPPDIGRIARAARGLEMATLVELRCIARAKRAAEINFLDAAEKDDRPVGIFTPLTLVDSLSEGGTDLAMDDVVNAVWSLQNRGIFVESKEWFTAQERMGYTTTHLYNEIFESCSYVLQT